MEIAVHFFPSSFFCIAIVAMQGIYKSEKTRKLKADMGSKCIGLRGFSRDLDKFSIPPSTLTLFITPIEEIIISLATIPQISAETTPAFPKPSGLNIGANISPICIKMLF